MNERENWLRAVEFRYPEWIPCEVAISPLNWKLHREAAEQIVLAHPRVFAPPEAGPRDYDEMPPGHAAGHYQDNWGCLWQVLDEGMIGQVVEHPLADDTAFDTYVPPDPLTSTTWGNRDWPETERSLADDRAAGRVAIGDGEYLFDRMYYLRGFTNLMYDIADDTPQLHLLVDMVETYTTTLTARWIEIGVDCIGFHTDLATQRGTMMSPAAFREFLKPMFSRLFRACRDAGVHVYLSTDGCVLDIVDDFIDCGVSVHDPQLRANTLDGIVRKFKGRLCARVDLDRQGLPHMTTGEVRRMVKDVTTQMGAPEGGLMLIGYIYGADIPLDNIRALAEAMEDYCF
jgi:uroporphyrinogen decarboxylase